MIFFSSASERMHHTVMWFLQVPSIHPKLAYTFFITNNPPPPHPLKSKLRAIFLPEKITPKRKITQVFCQCRFVQSNPCLYFVTLFSDLLSRYIQYPFHHLVETALSMSSQGFRLNMFSAGVHLKCY